MKALRFFLRDVLIAAGAILAGAGGGGGEGDGCMLHHRRAGLAPSVGDGTSVALTSPLLGGCTHAQILWIMYSSVSGVNSAKPNLDPLDYFSVR